MADNYQEILKLIGIEFDAASVGKYRDGFGVVDQTIFAIQSNEDFSHDLFHFYSEMKQAGQPRNWVAEEGLAYSWGNAYYCNSETGKMIDQSEMIEALLKYCENLVSQENKDPDYLALLEDHFWKDNSGILEKLAPDIKVGRLISSIICDAVEEKHGMKGVNELITCGKEPDHHEPFLICIEMQLGINRENFNQKLNKLLQQYQ